MRAHSFTFKCIVIFIYHRTKILHTYIFRVKVFDMILFQIYTYICKEFFTIEGAIIY